jgi:hypothetical protein
MNKPLTPTKTLDDLLRVLVRAWGFDTVLRHRRDLENMDSQRSHNKIRHRRTAMEYIERMQLSAQEKGILHELAYRFDSKRFLPTIGDIRYFLGA